MNLFITGGSGGIGHALVSAAVSAGHDVAFTFRQQADAAKQLADSARLLRAGARVEAIAADVCDSAAVERAVAHAVSVLGGLSGLVCNAAVVRPALLATLADADWLDTINTNLSGSFFAVRACVNEFLGNSRDKERGSIVLVSSLAARGLAGSSAYAASKAGLRGLCGSVAQEYGARGIRCNTVVPGGIDAGMGHESLSAELARDIVKHSAMNRLGKAGEVADAILFLLSPQASYINGQDLVVDGGLAL